MPNWFSDGRLHLGVGIEDTFVPQAGPGQRKLDEYELTQHYSHWREDFDAVAESGAGLLRWGIPWYLVEPRPGDFHWEWLDRVADRMSHLGLRCVVDLMHYGTPLWLDNQFLNAAYPERVALYARAVAERYGRVWTDYTPLNEPIINAVFCGEEGTWPPHLRGQDGFVRILMALARGIVLTQHAIRQVQPHANFVHVEAGFRWVGDITQPLPRAVLEERRFLALDLVMGRVDDSHPLAGYLLGHGVTERDLEWFAAHAVTPDVLGVNYYPAFTTMGTDASGSPVAVEAGVAGLRDLVTTYSRRYDLPLAITETSRSGSVESRVQWLRESVGLSHDLRAEGVRLVGYVWFPFFTLVDWGYRNDHSEVDDRFAHMGLLDLVRGADQELSRRRTDVFAEFQSLAAKPLVQQ
jgi:beta-glucosidase/6-phospho-beta-glucosidase/beta-galactosidase